MTYQQQILMEMIALTMKLILIGVVFMILQISTQWFNVVYARHRIPKAFYWILGNLRVDVKMI